MATFLVDAVVDHVVDGDTVVVDADLGLQIRFPGPIADLMPREESDLGWHIKLERHGDGLHLVMRMAVRIDGINAPEIATPEGKAAAEHAEKLLPKGTRVHVASKALWGSFEKYGRVLADLEYMVPSASRHVWASFTTAQLESGHAKPWDGHGPRPS